ncbi:unnamed protein product [Periconia digitata]|uniref:Heavy metal tolerance protein n=1 Tax=Periconia digitata TaxID=1303443 RepID=A0A9W4XX41_9PLEO|nr:unnamed protein product [Periconia digitata]
MSNLTFVYVFPVALALNIFFPQKVTPPDNGFKVRFLENKALLWLHTSVILITVPQLSLGLAAGIKTFEEDWYISSQFLMSSCLVMLLLFTDLVAKCCSHLPVTLRGMLTHIICLTQNFVDITIVMLFHDLPSVSHPFTLAQFILTMTKTTAIISILAIYGSSRPGKKDLEFERLADSIATHENGGYGTITSSNESHPPPKSQKPISQSAPAPGFEQFFKYIWPSHPSSLRVLVVLCFLLEILQRGINVFVPRTLGLIIKDLQLGVSPYLHIFLFVTFRACSGKTGLLGCLRSQCWVPIGQNTYRRITLSAFEWVLNLSLGFHLATKLGILTSALSKGAAIDQFLDFLLFSLVGVIADIVLAVGYFLLFFDFQYAMIVVFTSWAYVSATVYMALYRGKARRKMVDRSQEVNAVQTDALSTYEAVHLNSALELQSTKLSESIKEYQLGEFAVLTSLNALNAIQTLLFSLGILAVSLLCAYRTRQSENRVADFVTIVTYMVQLQQPLGFLGSVYNVVQNSLVDAEKTMSLFQEMPSVKDRDDAIELQACRGDVTFSNVHFSYTPGCPTIHDFSLTIPQGQSVAIVGESGSGKSTLLRLLLRFYDVDQGSITVDGVDIRDVTSESLRRAFGVVPQETILYNDTLMYNVRYANAGASEEDVYQACRAARIHEKIESLPEKYDTAVGERGLKLSGGERQRIAIARVILRAPSIVILDEATSSLDLETEKRIQTSLESVSRSRTSITIAHRLSTIAQSDVIVVLHKGWIVEKGCHADLMALGGRYSQMWEKQSEIRESPTHSE